MWPSQSRSSPVMRHESSQHEFVANCFAMNLPRLNSTDMASSHFAIGVSHIYPKTRTVLSIRLDRQNDIKSSLYKIMASQEWELLWMKTKKLSTIKFSRLFSDKRFPLQSCTISWSGEKNSHLEDKVLGILQESYVHLAWFHEFCSSCRQRLCFPSSPDKAKGAA